MIYNRYNLLFGEKYFERYLLFCEGAFAEKKSSSISLHHRGEEIDKGFVEGVRTRFREYEERLERFWKNTGRPRVKTSASDQEEAREVKRIYLKIAKRIHRI